jgi:selenocysteine lyase/cysteine desulfurase
MLSNQRHLFHLDDDVHYLNCAYMAPLLKSVEAAGQQALARRRAPHQILPEHFFHDAHKLRGLFARLVHCPDPQRVALVPSVSYGMAIVAKNLCTKPGQNIVVAQEQFPSNVYAWHTLAQERGLKLRTIAPPDRAKDRGQLWNERLWEAIDQDTALVALPHTHWADGTKFALGSLGARVHEVGGLLVVDGTQSVGALDFDVNEVRPDALVCAGYKWLMGPYSLGYAYFGEYFDQGKPLEEGWITRHNSEDFTGLVNYQPDYQPKALRYDVGERSNFVLVPMGIAALEQVLAWQPDRVQAYCAQLTQPLLEALPELGFAVEDPAWRGQHLLGLRLPPGLELERVRASLREHRLSVSFRGSAIRIAPHLYNDERDLAALVQALHALRVPA